MNTVVIVVLAGVATLCVAVWLACKAGGRVKVGFIVDVRWGQK